VRYSDWNSTREWPPKYVAQLLRAIREDLRQENFSIDLADKIGQRKIPLHEIRNAVNSPDSYIARYWYVDSNRVGIWHPKTRLLVVWKPRKGASPSRIMTCFYRADAIAYLREFPRFREICGSLKR